MLTSMTAFQRTTETGHWGSATLEIKTVNHRYLDMSIRLPDDLRMMEPVFREIIQNKLSRGKVDCTLRFDLDETDNANLEIDTELAQKLIKSANLLAIESSQPINPIDILKWPGVVTKVRPDLSTLVEPVQALLIKTLEQLIESRQREGGKLRDTILVKCENMANLVGQTRELLPKIISELRSRYQQKARELLDELDNDRLEQEILHLVQKMDVDEELDRLEIHLSEVKRVLDLNEPVGRRLDFLMQELNREANTLASKSINIDTSNSSIDLKVLIEQVREQIQNIE
jgi:uncharacterized protein (TIGR00255 family)